MRTSDDKLTQLLNRRLRKPIPDPEPDLGPEPEPEPLTHTLYLEQIQAQLEEDGIEEDGLFEQLRNGDALDEDEKKRIRARLTEIKEKERIMIDLITDDL